jgi:hypothetical protein
MSRLFARFIARAPTRDDRNVLQQQKLEREGAIAAREVERRETTATVNGQSTIQHSYHPVHTQAARRTHLKQFQEQTSDTAAVECNDQSEKRVQDRRSRVILTRI